MIFYVGIHQPCDAHKVERSCVSLNRLLGRKSAFRPSPGGMIGDSGAFTLINRDGGFKEAPRAFAARASYWIEKVGFEIVVSQDYMCEPFVLAKTGLTVRDHQRMTIERYDAVLEAMEGPRLLMPVLQGWTRQDYIDHLDMYGERLRDGMWVGVGSVCKRQGNVVLIEEILAAIHEHRPGLLLHGFGVKLTALKSRVVRERLYSADSMAWSYSARKQGRNGNSVDEALAFVRKVEAA